MTNKISIDNRELLQKISIGEAAAGIDFGNAIVRELAAFRLAAMDSEPVYQVFEPSDGRWVDVDDEEEMIRLRSIGGETRTLYTAPPSTVVDSEPVAWLLSGGEAKNVVCFDSGNAYADPLREVTPLYRRAQPAQTGVDDDVRNIIGLLETNEWAEHCTEAVLGSRLEAEITRLVGSAQPAPVVPGKMSYQDGVLFVLNNDMSSIERGTVAMRAWNACRAAMLQAGNSPVIPDGLIAAVNRLLDSDGSRGCYRAIRCYDARAEVERLLAAAPQEVPDGQR